MKTQTWSNICQRPDQTSVADMESFKDESYDMEVAAEMIR